MSHHYSGPNFGFPRGDARLDYTDLYAFPKPGEPSKSILIMDVHPSFNIDPPGPTTAEPFAPEALYEIKIDTNGDAVADIANRARSASSKGGAADRSTLAAGRTCTLTVGFAVIAAEGDALEGLRRCAARRARRPPERARPGWLSSRERRSRGDGRHR